MLHGYSPYSDPDSSDHRVIYRNILKGKLVWHESLRGESAARSLVKKLLEPNPARRYGSLRGGAKDVMSHRFFTGVDWKAVEAGSTRPPLRPKIKSQLDVSAFDEVEVKRTRIEPYVPDGTKWDASF
jgi:protein kinase A